MSNLHNVTARFAASTEAWATAVARGTNAFTDVGKRLFDAVRVDDAISDVYKNREHVVFNSGFSLERRDWEDKDWSTNILHRHDILKKLQL